MGDNMKKLCPLVFKDEPLILPPADAGGFKFMAK